MRQPSLFDSPPKPVERRPVNLELVRKHLKALLRVMRPAVVMPWHRADANGHFEKFPVYAALLPADEAEALVAEFNREWERLKPTMPVHGPLIDLEAS